MVTIAERFKSIAQQLDDDDLGGLSRFLERMHEMLTKGTVDGEPLSTDEKPDQTVADCCYLAHCYLQHEIIDRTPDDDYEEEEEEEEDEQPAAGAAQAV